MTDILALIITQTYTFHTSMPQNTHTHTTHIHNWHKHTCTQHTHTQACTHTHMHIHTQICPKKQQLSKTCLFFANILTHWAFLTWQQSQQHCPFLRRFVTRGLPVLVTCPLPSVPGGVPLSHGLYWCPLHLSIKIN